MYQESTVLKNLAILQRLTKGEAKLEDIAKSAGYRPKPTERSLKQLMAQGMVEEKNGTYRLREGAPTAKVSAALEIVMPWADFQTESFYEIARFAARTILTQSWGQARVKDVMLYGSTLRSGDALERRKPRDIDLLVLHCGNELAEFEESRYKDEGYEDEEEPAQEPKEIYDLPPGDQRTRRLNAFNSLLRLGYAEGEDIGDRAVKLIGDRIAPLEAGTLSEAEMRSWQITLRERIDELGAYIDVNGVSNVFDVHVMHTGLLGDENVVARAVEGLYGRASFGEEERARADTRRHYAEQREQAIRSCVDTTFWHRVFSEGRLYTLATDDFTKTIEDKYPCALKLFEGK